MGNVFSIYLPMYVVNENLCCTDYVVTPFHKTRQILSLVRFLQARRPVVLRWARPKARASRQVLVIGRRNISDFTIQF